MSNGWATFIYLVIYATITALGAQWMHDWFGWAMWVTVTINATLISPMLTLCVAFVIWPVLGMILGIAGLDNEEEQDIPQSTGENYVIDNKTGEQINPNKK